MPLLVLARLRWLRHWQCRRKYHQAALTPRSKTRLRSNSINLRASRRIGLLTPNRAERLTWASLHLEVLRRGLPLVGNLFVLDLLTHPSRACVTWTSGFERPS